MITAAVIAGGRSRRMGRDKAWIPLPDGRPLIVAALEVLREVADEVLIVANDPRFGSLGVTVVPDRWPDGGALGGIATAVQAATHETVLVVACDMPFLRGDALRLMVARSFAHDAVVPRVAGEYETLHAVYSKACLEPMERALAEGRLRIVSFFAEVDVHELDEHELRRLDATLRCLTNVNTPEELEAALA